MLTSSFFRVAINVVLLIQLQVVLAHDEFESGTLSYYIMAGDVLQVSVWGEDELQAEVLVRPDGGISFPLAGEIQASGKTVAELNAMIKKSIAHYIPDVEVTVAVTEILGNKIYVIGQVQNPGAIIMNPRLDVMQALSVAGGATPFAALNDIKILRRSSGNQVAIRFKYSEVADGRNLAQNVMLEPGDVVVVP